MPLTKVKSGGVSDSITLTSPDINAPDIDGGTIDNAVIGGSTAAAGSFTTITATGGSSSNWNTAYGWGDHSTQSYATETYVGTEVSNLVDSSPAALDTLNELAAALGDDPNFATTVTNSIALKAPLASPSFTGNVTMATGGSIVAGGANDLILNAGESGTPDIYLQSGGSTKVKVEGSNGNVGINETVPFGKLHISDTQTGRTTAGSVGNLLVLEDDENGMSILSADAGAGYILFGDTASASSGGIVYDHSANKFNFRTNDAWNRMILDASGNLLLGVTTAYSGGKLSVNGGIVQPSGVQNVMGVFGTSGLQMIGVTGGDNVIGTMGANEPLVLRTESAERMRIDPDGATIYNGKELRVKRPNGSGDIRLFNTASYATLESTVDPIYIKSANAIRFDTNGNDQRMLIDNSGRLGLGVTPEAWSSVFKVLRVGTGSSIAGESGGTSTWFNTNAYYDGSWKRINTNTSAQIAHTSDGKQEFKVAAAGSAGGAISWNTAMTVDNSGNLLVGRTSAGNTGNGHSIRGGDSVIFSRDSSGESMQVCRNASAGDLVRFICNGVDKGSIDFDGSNTVSYTTSSDQRLKENIADADDAGSKIDAIQVRKYDWKVDGSHQDYGMVAQELLEVAPEAVSGDADSEEMMGVDYSKLVPMLIKEIQSLRNRVAQLEE